MGMVITHARIIDLMVCHRTPLRFCTTPIPITPPTSAWEVETGNPRLEAMRTVVAVASSALKPLLGSSLVMFSPIVWMTFPPQIPKPVTIPAPPRSKIHKGTWKLASGMVPVF